MRDTIIQFMASSITSEVEGLWIVEINPLVAPYDLTN